MAQAMKTGERRIKVVILGKWPEGEVARGPQVYTFNLIKNLGKSEKLLLTVVSFGSDNKIIQEGNAKIILIKTKKIYHDIPLLALMKLRSEIRSIQPDLIHVLGSNMSPYLLSSLFFARNMQRILSVFGVAHIEQAYSMSKVSLSNRIAGLLERYALHKIPNAVVESHQCRNVIAKMTKGRIYIVPDGINYESIQNIKPNSDGAPDIFFVGELHPIKGVDLLIEAVPVLIKSFPDLNIYIAGRSLRGNTFDRQLLQSVAQRGLDKHIKFLGFISEEEKFRYLKACKVAVVPSRWDFSPIVIYEAAACGTPIVASTNTNSQIIDHGETGLLFKTGDANDLAEQILILLSDDGLAEKMGRKAQEKAAKCDWTKVADQMAVVYSEVASNTCEA